MFIVQGKTDIVAGRPGGTIGPPDAVDIVAVIVGLLVIIGRVGQAEVETAPGRRVVDDLLRLILDRDRVSGSKMPGLITAPMVSGE